MSWTCQAMLLQVPVGLQYDHLVGALQSLLGLRLRRLMKPRLLKRCLRRRVRAFSDMRSIPRSDVV